MTVTIRRNTRLTHPRTAGMPFPTTGPLQTVKGAGMTALSALWRINVHGRDNVPRQGPVILAANHIGTLDGPLIAMAPRRNVFTLAKSELFVGVVGWALRAAGQVPLSRDYPDVAALREAIHILRCGKALAIFPEGARGGGTCQDVRGGVGYLALVTGAPVVPVAFFGTRVPDTHRSAMPPFGSRIDVSFGSPVVLNAQPWPRTRPMVAEATHTIGEALRNHIDECRRELGVRLPGAIPVAVG